MGCCQSSAGNQPRLDPTAEASPRAHPNLPTSAQRSAHHHANAAHARPNAPLRAPSPLRKPPWPFPNQPWTRAQLQRERCDFFDTRIGGQAQIWAALRTICEKIRQKHIAEAQGFLDAANLTCPSGRVAYERVRRGRERIERGGVFDERGELYEIPAWILIDPVEVLDNDEDEDGDGEKDDAVVDAEAKMDEDALPAAMGKVSSQQQLKDVPPRPDKGKGRVLDVGEMLVLRARLSSTGSDMLVRMGAKEKVGVVGGRMCGQLAGAREVRLMYLGRKLDADKTLEEQGWQRDHVVNAMVLMDGH